MKSVNYVRCITNYSVEFMYVINFAFINLYFQDMRNLRFAHKVENHSRRLVYDKLMVFIDSSNLSLYF